MTKNKNYREFLDTGIIQYIKEEHLLQALDNIDRVTRKAYQEEAKALLTMLYYTGCRPTEALLCKSKDIEKDKIYLKIQLRTLKHGRARFVWINTRKFPVANLIWEWHLKKYHEEYMFFHFMGRYDHKRTWTKKNGMVVEKHYNELSQKLPYHMARWFDGVVPNSINPYFLRHNKFSKLANSGATDRELMQIKGSTTFASIAPYIHQSAEAGKKLANKGG